MIPIAEPIQAAGGYNLSRGGIQTSGYGAELNFVRCVPRAERLQSFVAYREIFEVGFVFSLCAAVVYELYIFKLIFKLFTRKRYRVVQIDGFGSISGVVYWINITFEKSNYFWRAIVLALINRAADLDTVIEIESFQLMARIV